MIISFLTLSTTHFSASSTIHAFDFPPQLSSVSSTFTATAFFSHLPEWAIEDDGCRTPDRGVGSCVPIRQCSHMVQFMSEIPKPYSNAVVSYLRRFQCGQEGNSIKVCCPSQPINNQFNRRGVDAHKNLKLLPLDSCGGNTDDRIINGNKTGIFEFPWMVLISYQTSKW